MADPACDACCGDEAPVVLCAPCALRPRVVGDFFGAGPIPGLALAMQRIRLLKQSVDAIVNSMPRGGR